MQLHIKDIFNYKDIKKKYKEKRKFHLGRNNWIKQRRLLQGMKMHLNVFGYDLEESCGSVAFVYNF